MITGNTDSRSSFGVEIDELDLRVKALINMAEAHIQQAYDLVELLKQAAHEVSLSDKERAMTQQEADEQGVLEQYVLRLNLQRQLWDLERKVCTAGQGTRPETN